MPEIALLPEETVSVIRSGINIPSLPAVLLELVQNSLDAGSTRIDCSFDLSRWLVRCEDNGSGITLDNLRAIGRYATSKDGPTNVSTFGFRGEALASLADVGLLEVHTATSSAAESYSLVCRDGKRLSLSQSSLPRAKGTTVTVRDIFFEVRRHTFFHRYSRLTADVKWPVRRKSLANPNARSSLINSLKDGLIRIALVHPHIAFSLSNTEGSPRRLLSYGSSRSGMLGRWTQAFGRADVEHVDEIDESSEDGSERLQGFISHFASLSKAQQFIFINSRPIATCALHKCMNETFASSKFPQHAKVPNEKASRTRAGTKGTVDRYPIFLLNLIVDPGRVDVTLEPQKTSVEITNEGSIIALLRNVALAFLDKQGMTRSETTKAADPKPASLAFPSSKPFSAMSANKAISPRKRQRPAELEACPKKCDRDNVIEWIDPETNRVFLVDQRSGHSWPKGHARCNSDPGCQQLSIGLVDRSHLKRTRTTGDGDDGPMPEWLDQAMTTWTNPTYAISSKVVKSLPLLDARARTQDEPIEPIGARQKLTKAALRRAKFVRQVDNKFLLVKVPALDNDDGHSSLVLIDQHAADERVRVERFLDELTRRPCPDKLTLDEPIAILLSARECSLLAQYVDRFGRWTINFEQFDSSQSQDLAQVHVCSIPMLVSDRLREAQTLQTLVKSYLSELESLPPAVAQLPQATQQAGRNGSSWLASLVDCPRTLVDLVNSKACRGAVMFNDVLSDERCESIVSRLANDTRFPFQCAHGRPSLVPLFNVRSTKGGHDERSRVDWSLLS